MARSFARSLAPLACAIVACAARPPAQSVDPSPASADAPSATPQPSAHAAPATLAYPNDVKIDATISMDTAIASKPPPSLRFVVRPTTFVRFHHLIVTGDLINDGDAEVEAIVFPAGPFVVLPDPAMHAKPPPPGRPSPPPPVPPPPLGIFVPARATVTFEAALDLTAFDYTPGARAELAWTFTFWNEPKPKGALSVALPMP